MRETDFNVACGLYVKAHINQATTKKIMTRLQLKIINV